MSDHPLVGLGFLIGWYVWAKFLHWLRPDMEFRMAAVVSAMNLSLFWIAASLR